MPKNTRIYKTGWVDSMKVDENGNSFKKSRLVARNYRDAAVGCVPTNSPTFTRWGQRLAISIAACCPNRNPYLRDISQAYTQSESPLDRRVYLQAPVEMKLSDEFVLQAIKPLYGIIELSQRLARTSSDHWTTTTTGTISDEDMNTGNKAKALYNIE